MLYQKVISLIQKKVNTLEYGAITLQAKCQSSYNKLF